MEDVIKQSAEEEARRKDDKPAVITLEQAADFASKVFGLSNVDYSKVKEFESYDDRNYFLGGVSYKGETLDVIFKVHNGVETDNVDLIHAHNTVLSHLQKDGIAVPEPLQTADGNSLVGEIDLPRITAPDTTRKHSVRLLRFIPGITVGQTAKESDALLRDMGRFVGDMNKKLLLLPAVPPSLEGRILLWDLKQIPALSTFDQYIIDPDRRKLQQKVLKRFNEVVGPKIPTLRKAVIQNDANEQNIVIDGARTKVTGIIDFGDCLYTCLVFELAICQAYMMLAKDDPINAAAQIYAGYVAEVPLEQEEKELLHTLICARLAQSLTMGAFSYSKDPNNEYLLITAETGWVALEAMEKISEADFLARMEAEAAKSL